MLGERPAQRSLFDADHMYLDLVGEDTFYGFLAVHGRAIFRDEDYAGLYSPDWGRPSVPPSMLAIAMLLQSKDRAVDDEAKARADFDLRWKVALGVPADARPFAKSTLQKFRAQLVLKDQMRAVFLRSLEYARQVGCLDERELRVVLDTTYILGQGAVKDTYNLLADCVRTLLRALAKTADKPFPRYARAHGYTRYLAASIKGEADVNWGDETARNEFLKGIVTDADRLLSLAEGTLASLAEGQAGRERIERGVGLLRQLVSQDVQRDGESVALKDGVARDRVISVHDPEMRHGRKSRTRRFDGHKAAVAVDAESQLITAVDVLAGNAPDNEDALALVEASEENTGLAVAETIGDCAYGDGQTRQAFADAERPLVAKVAARGRSPQYSKDAFDIDLDEMSCTCPAGQTTRVLVRQGYWQDRCGARHPDRAFLFAAAACATCQLRSACVKGKGHKGRTVRLHPQEQLLREARALQESPAFQEYRRLRQTAEHRLARLVQLGIRKARYSGRRKTLFQLMMAATVANLTLIARRTAPKQAGGRRASSFFAFILDVKTTILHHLAHLNAGTVSLTAKTPAFRLGF